jgi:hypothetical protein
MQNAAREDEKGAKPCMLPADGAKTSDRGEKVPTIAARTLKINATVAIDSANGSELYCVKYELIVHI